MNGSKEAQCPLLGNNKDCPLINSSVCLDWRCEMARELTHHTAILDAKANSKPSNPETGDETFKGAKLG